MCGALPTGMALLQASAGTGKTFTIAALTTRYVAEGVLPIDRLLVITFTRMATGELRERVRDRLVRAFDGLVDLLAGNGGHDDDEIVQLLAEGRRWRSKPGVIGWERRSQTSMPPPSKRPTGSAFRSSMAWGRPATSTGRSRSWRT